MPLCSPCKKWFIILASTVLVKQKLDKCVCGQKTLVIVILLSLLQNCRLLQMKFNLVVNKNILISYGVLKIPRMLFSEITMICSFYKICLATQLNRNICVFVAHVNMNIENNDHIWNVIFDNMDYYHLCLLESWTVISNQVHKANGVKMNLAENEKIVTYDHDHFGWTFSVIWYVK